MSFPEIQLWGELRRRPARLKFRRQHPSGPYTLDFYCNDAKLAIEVDGEAHGCGKRVRTDAARDRWMAGAGIETMRVPAGDVMHDPEGVARAILNRAITRLPRGHPACP